MKEEKSVIKPLQLTGCLEPHNSFNSNTQFWSFALFSVIHSGLISQLLETNSVIHSAFLFTVLPVGMDRLYGIKLNV